jgi:NAD(P)H-flavin reductase
MLDRVLSDNMIAPKQCTAKLADKIVLNDRYVQLKFEWTEPHLVQFQAGQYISVSIPNRPDRRSYSIVSTPDDEHGFDLLIDLAPNGLGVNYLTKMKFGEEMSCLAPLGFFVVPEKAAGKPLHFVATGSGIAPYRSMILNELQVKKNTQLILLYWGMREVNNLFWEDEFAELRESFPNFKFHPVASRPPADWPLCRGRVTDCLTIHPLLPEAEYFACGGEPMVTQVTGFLLNKGVAKENIHREKFF